MCAGGECLHPLDIIILIYAYFQAIMSAVGVILGLSYVVVVKEMVIQYLDTTGKDIFSPETDDEVRKYLIIVSFTALTVVFTILLLGNLIVSSVLIHGVQKRKKQHVMVYLITAIIVNVMYTSGVIMTQVLLDECTFRPYITSLWMLTLAMITHDTYKRVKRASATQNAHKIFTNEQP